MTRTHVASMRTVVGVAVGVGVGVGAGAQATSTKIIARVSTGSSFIVLPTVILATPILEWRTAQINQGDLLKRVAPWGKTG